MPGVETFDEYYAQYEDWFEKHIWAYASELEAIRRFIPSGADGVEIGVGSGRFAAPLGIKTGLEPSAKMREIAASRGIQTFDGTAEDLPFPDARFDLALMVTVVCFLDDAPAAFREAYRVLKPGGRLIVAWIDRESPIGRLYQQHQNENVFYKSAVFRSVPEIVAMLTEAGFGGFDFLQTIFHVPAEITVVEPAESGYGKGSFVVIKAEKG